SCRQGSGVLRRSADARPRKSEARRRQGQGLRPDDHSAAHAPERRAARTRGAVDDPFHGRALRRPLRPDPAAAARASGDESGGETVVSDAATARIATRSAMIASCSSPTGIAAPGAATRVPDTTLDCLRATTEHANAGPWL